MKKQDHGAIGAWIVGFFALVFSFAFYILGAKCGSFGVAADPLLAAALGAELVWVIISVCAVGIRKKRRAKIEVKAGNDMLLRRQTSAEDDLAGASRRVRRAARGTVFCAVLLLLLAMFQAYLCGCVGEIGILVFPFFLFWPFAFRIFKYLWEKPDFTGFSDPKDYPVLYAAASRARDKVGERGEIRIYFDGGYGCAIARTGKFFSLVVGVSLLAVEDEEELYQVFLHEFAHMSSRFTPRSVPNRVRAFIEMEDGFLCRVGAHLIGLPRDVFFVEYVLYLATASRFVEAGADSAVRTCGTPAAAGAALCKISMFASFMQEAERGMWIGKEPFYASETPPKDVSARLVASFGETFAERQAFWRSLYQKEIQSRRDSHPILRDRLTSIGVTLDEVVCRLPDNAGSAYRAECDRALAEADERAYRQCDPEAYAEAREENYLEPLRTVTEFEAGGCVCDPAENAVYIRAYGRLCRFAEQEALCDKILAGTENVYATVQANFTKGELLLWRYDAAGLDYLWKAIDLNTNCQDDALELIGEFCCRMGLEKELEDYRARAPELQQKKMDTWEHTTDLSLSDHLETEHALDEKLPEILSFMTEAGEGHIRDIYLVRKIIAEEFFSSVFVIDFDGEADEEETKRAYDKIFRYLDTYPEEWQFSLFLCGDYERMVVEKVPDSHVWHREE